MYYLAVESFMHHIIECDEEVETIEKQETGIKEIVSEFFPEGSMMREFYNLGEELYTLEDKKTEEDLEVKEEREAMYIVEGFLEHILSMKIYEKHKI